MIDITVQYQASAFVNASDIVPNADTISSLIDDFRDKELIPSTFQELVSPNPVAQPRIQFSGTDGEWMVMIPSNRINITKSAIGLKGDNIGDVDTFCSEALGLFERLTARFSKKSHRLSLVTNFFLGEMIEENLDRIYRKLFNPPKFYTDHTPYEWFWRSVARTQLESLQEDINIITTIQRVSGEIGAKESVVAISRIKITFDINTSQQLLEQRFELSHLQTFFNSVPKVHESILDEIMEFIDG